MAKQQKHEKKARKPRPYRPPPAGAEWGSPNQACGFGGFSRSTLYDEILPKHPEIARKLNARTIINIPMLGEILAALPQMFEACEPTKRGRPRKPPPVITTSERGAP